MLINLFILLEKKYLEIKNEIDAPKKALIKTIKVPNKDPYKNPANNESQDPGNKKITEKIYIKKNINIPKLELK